MELRPRKEASNNSTFAQKKIAQPSSRKIDFANLPYGIQTSIFKKFDYKQFSNFESSSSSAFAFCEKHRDFKFPLEIGDISICPQDDDFLIKSTGTRLDFADVGDQAVLKVNKCSVHGQEVLSQERFEFYKDKILRIGEYVCNLNPTYDQLFAQFLMSKKIDKILMNLDGNENYTFMYNTEEIKVVGLHGFNPISAGMAFSMKAKVMLNLWRVEVTVEEVVNHIKTLLDTTESFPKKFFFYPFPAITKKELEKGLKQFGRQCTRRKNLYCSSVHLWAIHNSEDVNIKKSQPSLEIMYNNDGLATISIDKWLHEE